MINQRFFALCTKAITQKLKKASFLAFELCLNRAFHFDDHDIVINASSFSCVMIITNCRAVAAQLAS